MAISLHGKRIWLIGASHGIGAALVPELIAAGARLIISARSIEPLDALAAPHGQEHCIAVPCDVTSLHSVADAATQSLAAYGGLDMVIYNAGTYTPMSSLEFDLDAVEAMIDVNLHGALRVLSCVLPVMRVQPDGGTIVLVGSVAGYRGLPKAMGYGLSKAALIHLAENLRQDGEESNIRVQIVNPGFVRTRLTEQNRFAMPMMISPQQAASAIMRGLRSGVYEIHFPRAFTYTLKLLSLLPHRLYFWLSSRLM